MSAVKVSCLMPSGSANCGRGGRPGPNVSDMTPLVAAEHRLRLVGQHGPGRGYPHVINPVKTELARLVHVAADDQGRRVGPEQAGKSIPRCGRPEPVGRRGSEFRLGRGKWLMRQQRDPQALTCLRDLLAKPGPLPSLRREPRTDKLRVNAKQQPAADPHRPPVRAHDIEPPLPAGVIHGEAVRHAGQWIVTDIVVTGNGAPRHRKQLKLAARMFQVGRVARAVQTEVAEVDDQVGVLSSDVGDDSRPVGLRLGRIRRQMGIRNENHAGGHGCTLRSGLSFRSPPTCRSVTASPTPAKPQQHATGT